MPSLHLPRHEKRIGMTTLDTIKEILEDNAFIQDDDPFDLDESVAFTRFVVEVGQRLGIEIDIENVSPTTLRELVTQIEEQLKRT